MASLEEIAEAKTTLRADQLRHLRSLAANWQIVADLSFCDLVLWLDDSEAKGRWAAALVRPMTGPTTLDEDIVGQFWAHDPAPSLEPSTTEPAAPRSAVTDSAVTEEASEVRFAGERIATLVRRRPVTQRWPGSALELAYAQTGDLLHAMIARGDFPDQSLGTDAAGSMRVGDGFVRTDSRGRVLYASPNALSAYRRLGLLGDLVGTELSEVTRYLVGRNPTDRALSSLLDASESVTELEAGEAFVQLRSIRLVLAGVEHGHAVLLRDVTDLRLRERELVSKDATIREIHHRVKNNLQTVAALLRLQGRRLDSREAREALHEAEQRVGSIALVHETLSQSFDDNVDFDEIADTLTRTIPEMGAVADVHAARIGTFGVLPGEVATTLALVLTELVQNAVEHAFTPDVNTPDPNAPIPSRGGRVTVAANRIRGRLKIRVSDTGHGLPQDFDPSRSLGLSIVSTLVTSELRGTLSFGAAPAGGAVVTITIDV